jgi:hypothetical protein
MTKTVFIFLLCVMPVSLFSQETDYLVMVKSETRLQDLFNRLYSDTIADVEPILDSIRNEMTEALSMQGSMDFPWSKLDRIGIINSEDKQIRVFTWHVMDDVDDYRYFGFIQVRLKKERSKLYELKDNGKPQRGIMKFDQTKSDWYGKLYYQVLTNHYKRKTYYTLLGMDFNNARSTIKSVEVMTIQRNDPQFARSLFIKGSDFVDRLVLEYDSQVAISLRYNPRIDMIIFDHLVPFHPIYNGNFEFYGPDGSFDGLEFSEGRWIYHADIDARNMD